MISRFITVIFGWSGRVALNFLPKSDEIRSCVIRLLIASFTILLQYKNYFNALKRKRNGIPYLNNKRIIKCVNIQGLFLYSSIKLKRRINISSSLQTTEFLLSVDIVTTNI